MIIKRIELVHIAIPLKRPFETSFGVISQRPALIIAMTANDDRVGYGESSPLYVPLSEPETVETTIPFLKRILPSFIGLPVTDDFNFPQKYSAEIFQFPISMIGIEGAYLDLLAQQRYVPIRTIFGATRDSVTVGESVGIKPMIDEVVREVARYVHDGYQRVKIKVKPGHDLEVIRAVRAAFPTLALGADANAAYGPGDLVRLAVLATYDLAFIEQPFAADDYTSHAALRRYGVPVALDETVRDLETCQRAIESDCCDIINIKPARIGSFAVSRAIHDCCVRSNVRLFGGGRLETGIGKTANAHFYTLPGFTDPSDLTPPLDYFENDIIEPTLVVERGIRTVSDRPGLGIDVSTDRVAHYARERFVFT